MRINTILKNIDDRVKTTEVVVTQQSVDIQNLQSDIDDVERSIEELPSGGGGYAGNEYVADAIRAITEDDNEKHLFTGSLTITLPDPSTLTSPLRFRVTPLGTLVINAGSVLIAGSTSEEIDTGNYITAGGLGSEITIEADAPFEYLEFFPVTSEEFGGHGATQLWLFIGMGCREPIG